VLISVVDRVLVGELGQRQQGDLGSLLLAADLEFVGQPVTIDGVHCAGPVAAMGAAPHVDSGLLHGIEEDTASGELPQPLKISPFHLK